MQRQSKHERQIRPIVRHATLGIAAAWLTVVAGLGSWASHLIVAARLNSLAVSAEFEAKATARVIDRLFTEMISVANMTARQGRVIQLAARYRTDSLNANELTREQRDAQFTQDPLVREVGDFMNALSNDLHYARIYMNNMSYDTVTASNWNQADSIVGMIYSDRPHLIDAMRNGNGSSFGVGHLNGSPSYFVASRIDGTDGIPLGTLTVRFDASDVALYLTGRDIMLIVDRQGRVITTSFAPFMLRNVAALLSPSTARPADDDEDPGAPIDIYAVTNRDHIDHWLIDGKPYLLRHQSLSNTQYQLITLAALDEVEPMRRRHLGAALGVAAFGLTMILLSGYTIGQMLMRRHDEKRAANHDALTSLPNRRAMLAELDRLFALARRSQQWVLVAYIDLDEFKAINDTHGHETGDKFLIEIGRRAQAGLRAGDMLGRWGGDEFVVIGLTTPPKPDDREGAVLAMRSRLEPLLIGTYTFAECSFDYPGASLGIVNVDPSIDSRETALKEADRRMYVDKKRRRAQKPDKPSH